MREMHMPARDARECDIARHHDGFRRRGDAGQAKPGRQFAFSGGAAGSQARFFRVLHNEGAKGPRVRQRKSHGACRGNGAHPIRKGNGAGGTEQAEFGQFLAGTARCRGAIGQQRNRPRGLTLPRDEGNQRGIIKGGVGIRQHANGGDAARCGGLRGGGDGFPMLCAGFAEVGAQINQARCETGARGIHHGGTFGRSQASAAIGDQPITDQQSTQRIKARGWVEQAGIGDDRVSHAQRFRGNWRESISSTAMRQATPISTCSPITLRVGWSATALSISTPRFIGPGCITIESGLA